MILEEKLIIAVCVFYWTGLKRKGGRDLGGGGRMMIIEGGGTIIKHIKHIKQQATSC